MATGLVAHLGTGTTFSIKLKFAVVPFHMVLISQQNWALLCLIVTRTLPLSATYDLLHTHVFLYSSCIARYPILFKALYSSPPGRPVHSNAISNSLKSIQPHCNHVFLYSSCIARYPVLFKDFSEKHSATLRLLREDFVPISASACSQVLILCS